MAAQVTHACALVYLDSWLLVLIILDDAKLAERRNDLLHGRIVRQASHVHARVDLRRGQAPERAIKQCVESHDRGIGQ